MNNKHDTPTIVSYIILLSGFVFMVYLFIMLTYPFKVTDYYTNRLPVISKTVKQGEAIGIVFRYKKYVDLPARVTRMLKNDAVVLLPDMMAVRNRGDYSFISYTTKIPTHTPPGKYTLVFGFHYQISPIRTIIKTKETEEFIVVKKD